MAQRLRSFVFFTRVSPLQEGELLGVDRRKKLLPETQSDIRFSTLSFVDHEKWTKFISVMDSTDESSLVFHIPSELLLFKAGMQRL